MLSILISLNCVSLSQGWAYHKLEPADSALGLAKSALKNFLQTPQGAGFTHNTPKLLSIVETDAFLTFMEAWEGLSAEMDRLLAVDRSFTVMLRRARNDALSFVTFEDTEKSKSESGLDVGSLMTKLADFCQPDSSSAFASLLSTAQSAYKAQFVVEGNGPGTPDGTGMYVMWPTRTVYHKFVDEQDGIDDRLFNSSYVTSTQSAPKFLRFLKNFYELPTPTSSSTKSVCTASFEDAAPDGKLLADMQVEEMSDSAVVVGGKIGVDTDRLIMFVMLEISDLLFSDDKARAALLARNIQRHRAQVEEKLYFYFSHKLSPTISATKFQSTWNRKFLMLQDEATEQHGLVTMRQFGPGLAGMEVVYFRQGFSQKLPVITQISDAVKMGGVFGYLMVSINSEDDIIEVKNLYTFDKGTLSEEPRSEKGIVSPVATVSLPVGDDATINEIVGGFTKALYPWKEGNKVNAMLVSDKEFMSSLNITELFLTVVASDEDRVGKTTESDVMPILYDSNGEGTLIPPGSSPSTPTPPAPAPVSQPNEGRDSKVCFMVFFNADNDQESFLRSNFYELTKAPAIESPNIDTWVYFDSRSHEAISTVSDFFPDGSPVFRNPLENVYDETGELLTSQHTAPRIMHWDHDSQKMVAVFSAKNEGNSDLYATFSAFLEVAVTKCMKRGYGDEFFFLLAGPGGGYGGFGGDEDIGIDSSQGSVAFNHLIKKGIVEGLRNVQLEGKPSRLDVMAFDASSMQAIGVLDDLGNLTKHFMAGESVSPGSGFAYEKCEAGSNALDLAQSLLQHYMEVSQGNDDSHGSPKTLSIIRTAHYESFLRAWDDLAAEFEQLLKDDYKFSTLLRRSRNNALSFIAPGDNGLFNLPSGLDIGDFLSTFKGLCEPDSSSTLSSLLRVVEDAYELMVESVGDSPNTPDGTGMYVMWPTQTSYNWAIASNAIGNLRHMNESYIMATTDAPKYLQFLERFFSAEQPSSRSGTSSVCTASLDSVVSFGAQVTQSTDAFTIKGGAGDKVDDTYVKVALDYTPAMPTSSRRLLSSDQRQSQSSDHFLFPRKLWAKFGNESKFEASWDRYFAFLTHNGTKSNELVTLTNLGVNGQAMVEVVYFPKPPSDDLLSFGSTTFSDAYSVGGRYGYLLVSVDGSGSDISINHLYSSKGAVISEIPRGQGVFAPVLSVLFPGKDGTRLGYTVGGPDNTLYPWQAGTSIKLRFERDSDYLKDRPTKYMALALYPVHEDEKDEKTKVLTFEYRYNDDGEAVSLNVQTPMATSIPAEQPPAASPVVKPTIEPTEGFDPDTDRDPTKAPIPSPEDKLTSEPTEACDPDADRDPTKAPISSPEDKPTSEPTEGKDTDSDDEPTKDPTVDETPETMAPVPTSGEETTVTQAPMERGAAPTEVDSSSRLISSVLAVLIPSLATVTMS